MAHLFTADLSFDWNGPGQQVLAILQSLTSDDDLWVLGMAMPSTPEALDLSPFSTVSAHLHLIRGAHEHETLISSPIWSSVDFMTEVTVDGQLIVLSSFPLMTWRGAQEDTGPIQGSLHLFGNGGAAHPGWWRAVNVSLNFWEGRFAALPEIRERSEDLFFVSPFLEPVYPNRRRIHRCDICSERMDRAVPGRCYRWHNGTIVTFFGEAVLSRIAEFPDWNLPPFTDEKSSFCADCLHGALSFSDIHEGTHYIFAPGMDLQAVWDGRISGSNPRLFTP